MVLEKNYCTMCAEVLEILKYCTESDINKIPKNLIESLKLNKGLNSKVIINPDKGIFEQNVSNETIIMMFIIFRNYWATDEEKNEIDEILKENEIKYKDLYPVDNLFENHTVNIHKEISNEETEQTSLVKYHETIIRKFVKLIKKFFKR